MTRQILHDEALASRALVIPYLSPWAGGDDHLDLEQQVNRALAAFEAERRAEDRLERQLEIFDRLTVYVLCMIPVLAATWLVCRIVAHFQ